MNHIRKMDMSNTNEMFDLAAYAFNSEKSEKRKKRFDWIVSHSKAYGYFEEEVLTSQLLATSFKVDFHGVPYKMGGIGCVSSYPEYRGQGSITALMKQMLFDLASEKVALSYLAPFSYPFYRRYGYEQLFEEIDYKMTAQHLPKIPSADGKVYRVNWEQAKDTVKAIYEEKSAQHPGGLIRDDWWLDYKFDRDEAYNFAIAKNKDDQPEGYLVYQITSDQFVIKECKAISKNGYQILARFITSHNGTVPYFSYNTGFSGEDLSYLLPAPILEMQIKPFMMGRIVDFQTFIESYPFYKQEKEAVFYLTIQDEFGPWNHGSWELSIGNGQGRLVKMKNQTNENSDNVLEGDIQSWTQLFMGYRSGATLYKHGRISGDIETIRSLDQLLPEGRPILEDYF